jgi:hypothetical protein
MSLHFAYGANMSRAVMRRYAPEARPIGVAELADYRFVVTADGYASVVPARGETVHGVLWQITPRDRAALDAWENISAGLYRAAMLPVRHAGRNVRAIVYRARPCGEGRPKPGYMQLVIAAAREWQLPSGYISRLQRRSSSRALGSDARKIGEFS